MRARPGVGPPSLACHHEPHCHGGGSDMDEDTQLRVPPIPGTTRAGVTGISTVAETRWESGRFRCGPCSRADGLVGSSFRGWLGGDPGLEWAWCAGCGWHLLDDAGSPACGSEPELAAGGCTACLALAGEGVRS